MNAQQRKKLIRLIQKTEEEADHVFKLSLGYLRYEALRKIGPSRFAELHVRNLKGERFDDMVDELVVKGGE